MHTAPSQRQRVAAGRGAAEFGAGAAGVPLAAGDLLRELPVWQRLPERRGVVVAGARPRRRRLAAAETASQRPPVAAPQAGLGAAKLGAGAAGVPLAAGDLLRELPVWQRLPERRGVVVAGALPRRRRLAAAATAPSQRPPVAAPQAGRGAAKLGAGAAGVPLAAGDLPRELPVWQRLPERRGVVVAGALPRRASGGGWRQLRAEAADRSAAGSRRTRCLPPAWPRKWRSSPSRPSAPMI